MVQVAVEDGILEGEIVNNEYGGSFCSFKGIPYARPPLGDLRFKAPQPPQPWNGVRQAKEFGPVCVQYNFMNPNIENSSEDCLYLNVYTPELNPPKLLPVMFWIHGGGFLWGSGNDDMYGPEFLVRLGVILVTFNYRLETIGFLCLNTEDVPGNAGMKDQVAALKWVRKNIKKFGGDPENITIFGESAGGASVSFHLVSPMTKGLFKRAITQSGAATCWWSQGFAPRERAILLARQLGLFSDNDKELYEFFKKQPVESLVKVSSPIVLSAKSYEIPFGVVSEKQFGNNEAFFTGDIIDALRHNVHEGVKIMTGYTADEGLMALGIGDNIYKMIEQAKFHREFFTPKAIQIHCTILDQLAVGREIEKFYFDNEVVSIENVDKLIKYLGMDFFTHEIMMAANLYTKTNKVYLYKFSCKSERNIMSRLFGINNDVLKNKIAASHADDLPYVFNGKVASYVLQGEVDKNSDTFGIIDRITRLWTNFAKYGNPTPDSSLGVKWKPYTTNKKDYIEIGNQISEGTSPDKEEISFWENIFKKYLPKYDCSN